jgi:hypothetical protein
MFTGMVVHLEQKSGPSYLEWRSTLTGLGGLC